jgi:hypothetical protein
MCLQILIPIILAYLLGRYRNWIKRNKEFCATLFVIFLMLASSFSHWGDSVKNLSSHIFQEKSIQLSLVKIKEGSSNRSIENPKFVIYINRPGDDGIFFVAKDTDFDLEEIRNQGLIDSVFSGSDTFDFCTDCNNYYILGISNLNKYREVKNIDLDISGYNIHESPITTKSGCNGENPCMVGYDVNKNFECSETKQNCSFLQNSLEAGQEIKSYLAIRGNTLTTNTCTVNGFSELCKKKNVDLIFWPENNNPININGYDVPPPVLATLSNSGSSNVSEVIKYLDKPQCYLLEKATQDWTEISCFQENN